MVDWGRRVNRWRPLVTCEFLPEHVEEALGVIYYESRGNRFSFHPISFASGLFQHKRRYWKARARRAGWAGYSPFNAAANIATSAWLLYDGWSPETAPNWQHWAQTHPSAVAAIERGHL